ncbi:MAG: PadR family transcriptional regulator [Dehalococcoidia bacterium]
MSLRYVLLAVLSKQPNTGYGIGKLLRTELRHIWQARLQQIYSDLARSEAEGLVRAQVTHMPNRPAKKVYSLTPAGTRALDDWLAQPPGVDSARDDLMVRLYCLPSAPLDLLVRRLEERRDHIEARARELRRALEEASSDPNTIGYLLTLEGALAGAEAQIAWCERAVSTLGERAANAGAPFPRDQGIQASGA